jgi:hypothetical protein
MTYQVVRQEGIEPPTCSLEGCRSIQLSYWRWTASKFGANHAKMEAPHDAISRMMPRSPRPPTNPAGRLVLSIVRERALPRHDTVITPLQYRNRKSPEQPVRCQELHRGNTTTV